ncbi:conserved exported protein of unknown function [Tenacibaculum sp. 190130A14a]|uniref:Esterase n=1 Tax=Tenacibaculum polynesiense TaxID=3137857 RepID=A0ABP1ETC8_9FLAO
MKHLLAILSLLVFHTSIAQSNYTEVINKATKIAQQEDTLKYNSTLKLLDTAFKKYPDSINGTGLYYASIMASSLKLKDKAFSYLIPLVKMEKDDQGYPGWSFALDSYAQKDYKNLLNDDRWKSLTAIAKKDSITFFEKLKTQQTEFFQTSTINLSNINNPKKLYKSIHKYNTYLPKKQQNYSISLKINNSTESAYLVHLPKHYNPRKKYPVLFFLHGAVRFTEFHKYRIPEITLGGWNKYYTKYGDLSNVILIFPGANKEYNWMLSNKGFYMIPEILKSVKKALNIDDNKVFISGHSNGATGSFSYLMKQPTLFAGFYGFNTQPKVFTGGTFVENGTNRSFVHFSTDQDYYYPPKANDDFTKLMTRINENYQEYRYKGFPHWFPEFKESEPAYKILFNHLEERKRDPFPKQISWEFDDNTYGDIDWISNIKLDTLQSKAQWHKNLNFKITEWLSYNNNDSLVSKKVDKKAFDFPRKSGKVKARYANNSFHIQTSCISTFKINISPEMVNLNKKVKIYINGKIYFDKKVKYNRIFMLEEFLKNGNRTQIWVNQIKLKV